MYLFARDDEPRPRCRGSSGVLFSSAIAAGCPRHGSCVLPYTTAIVPRSTCPRRAFWLAIIVELGKCDSVSGPRKTREINKVSVIRLSLPFQPAPGQSS